MHHHSSTSALAAAAQQLASIDRHAGALTMLQRSYRDVRQTLRDRYAWLDHDLWDDALNEAVAKVFADAAAADLPVRFAQIGLQGLTSTATEAGEALHYAITRHRREMTTAASVPVIQFDQMADL